MMTLIRGKEITTPKPPAREGVGHKIIGGPGTKFLCWDEVRRDETKYIRGIGKMCRWHRMDLTFRTSRLAGNLDAYLPYCVRVVGHGLNPWSGSYESWTRATIWFLADGGWQVQGSEEVFPTLLRAVRAAKGIVPRKQWDGVN